MQAHFWDLLEIACWYWPDLAIIQATKLGLGRISLTSKLNVKSMGLNPRKSKQPIPASYFKDKSKKSLDYFSSRLPGGFGRIGGILGGRLWSD